MDCRATTSGGGSAAHSWIAGSSCFRKMSVVCQLANQNHSWRIMATVRWVPGYGQDLPSEAQEVGQGRFSYVRRVTHSSLRWVHRHDSDDSYAKVISRYSCNRVHSLLFPFSQINFRQINMWMRAYCVWMHFARTNVGWRQPCMIYRWKVTLFGWQPGGVWQWISTTQ